MKLRDMIKSLQDPKTLNTTHDSQEMVRIAAMYHNEIQSMDRDPTSITDRPKLEKALTHPRTRLSTKSKEKLQEKISEGETYHTIRETNNNKAPGLNSIPIELWKTMVN